MSICNLNLPELANIIMEKLNGSKMKLLRQPCNTPTGKCKSDEYTERTIKMEWGWSPNSLKLSYSGGFMGNSRPRTLVVPTNFNVDGECHPRKNIEFTQKGEGDLLSFRGTQEGGDCSGQKMHWQFKLTPTQLDALTAAACKGAYFDSRFNARCRETGEHDNCVCKDRRDEPCPELRVGGRKKKRKTKRRSKRKSKRRRRKTRRRR